MKAAIVSSQHIVRMGFRLDARCYLTHSHEDLALVQVNKAKTRLRNTRRRLKEARALDRRLAEEGQLQWLHK